LLPALEAFGAGKDICFVMVLIRDPDDPKAPAKLGGLFPLEFTPRVSRLEVPALSMWQHVHCRLCTPLVRADAVHECMVELFLWLRSGEARASMIELKLISGDGPFRRALTELFDALGMVSWETGILTRGFLRKGRQTSASINSLISKELRRTLHRKEARLRERGWLEHVVLKPGDDVGRWIEEFLRIEADSSKGRRDVLPAWSETYRRYFTEMATSAHQRARLLMVGINFDGRPIARSCAFVAAEGSFAWKTACAEGFARFSPDAMIELDTIRQLYELPEVRWLDSCTDRETGLINRLSNDRRTLQSLAVGGAAAGELLRLDRPLPQ
jgi:hypothetical protein